MNDVAMLLDGNPVDHWIDYALGALFALAVWLLQRSISAGDRRQEADRKEVREQGKQLGDHETRITVIERLDEKDRRQ